MSKRISSTRYGGVFYRELKGGDKSYEFCYQDAGVKRWVNVGRSSLGVTAAKTNEARLIALANLKTVAAAPPAAPKVSELLTNYLNGLDLNISFNKVKTSIVNHVLTPFFGDLTLDQINKSKVEELKRSLVDKSSGHQNKIYGVMRHIINQAIEDGSYQGLNYFLAANGFKYKGRDIPCERFLTVDEAALLLEELNKVSPMWRDMAYLSLHTGVRLTELYQMTCRDLQPGQLTAIIRAKIGGKQVLYLTPEAREIIVAWSSEATDLIFPTAKETTKVFYDVVKSLGFNDGLVGLTNKVWFHTLRHTFASWLAQKGVDLYVIQRLMRHKSIAMTQRYAHLRPDNLLENLNVIRSVCPSLESGHVLGGATLIENA
jgi:integrase